MTNAEKIRTLNEKDILFSFIWFEQRYTANNNKTETKCNWKQKSWEMQNNKRNIRFYLYIIKIKFKRNM